MSKGNIHKSVKKLNINVGTSAPWQRWFPLLVFSFAIGIYANTLSHGYTQDDAIVITDNMFTQEGLAGIPGLLNNDTFYGFFKTEGKAKLVSGGRYRPLTPIMFALEHQISANNPFLGHLMNVLWYALLCMMIYHLLLTMLSPHWKSQDGFLLFVLFASLIFATHPLHTEAVANIKGRDEIISMLGAILSLYYAFKYVDTSASRNILLCGLCFFVGLFAKETTITFLAVIPLSIYCFRPNHLKKIGIVMGAVGLAAVGFIIIRSSILGFDFGGTPMELMNNPFIKIENGNYVPFSFGEKSATIIYTLGKYLQLLIFPHPLTHDYYPRHIGVMTWSDISVWVSLLSYILLGIIAIVGLKNRSIISFCILYFIVTTSIVSNIVFPIGTNMSERFMFMPSLGFALLVPFLAWKFLTRKGSFVFLLGIMILLFSIKTISRNQVWKSDFTLFSTDVKTSSQSAKVLNAAGGALLTESMKESNDSKRSQMLTQATVYLKQALEIHPNYKNASMLLGNSYFYQKEYEKAVKSYERTLNIAPGYKEAENNLAVAYRDAGRYAGEKQNDLEKAKRYLKQSLQLSDRDPDTYRLMGITYGMAGDHIESIKYFTKVTEMQPENAGAFVNLGMAYQYYGDEETSRIMLQKAVEIDPKALNKR